MPLILDGTFLTEKEQTLLVTALYSASEYWLKLTEEIEKADPANHPGTLWIALQMRQQSTQALKLAEKLEA